MLSADPDIRRLMALRAIEGGLLRLKWLAAATRFEIAMRRHDSALKAGYRRKYGFNPDQPRVPRGQPEGGEWTDGGSSPGRIRLAGDIPTNDPPDILKKRPSTSRERTSAKKTVARWLDRVGGAFETVAAVAKLGAWLQTYSAEIESYRDPSKSLAELQQAVSTPAPGYDKHHIVQRNQTSVFGKEAIDGPENLVLIPRLKHQEINGWYETKNPEFGGQSPRQYLNGRNWDVQRAVGLEALRKSGVLTP